MSQLICHFCNNSYKYTDGFLLIPVKPCKAKTEPVGPLRALIKLLQTSALGRRQGFCDLLHEHTAWLTISTGH